MIYKIGLVEHDIHCTGRGLVNTNTETHTDAYIHAVIHYIHAYKDSGEKLSSIQCSFKAIQTIKTLTFGKPCFSTDRQKYYMIVVA